MNVILQPWQLLLLILAGWINRQQQEIIEYLRTENRILRESHGWKRIRLNDDQRRHLAVKGKTLGRKILGEIGTIVTPDTILRWHRILIRQKWDYSHRRKQVGALGNVGHGGTRNPRCNRKSTCRELSTYSRARPGSARPALSRRTAIQILI